MDSFGAFIVTLLHIFKHSGLTTYLFRCVQCRLRGFPEYSQNTVRTFNVSTPGVFPKYVELTMGMLLLFIYHQFISVLNFRFVLFSRDLF